MPIFRATARIQARSLIPREAFVNVWHYQTVGHSLTPTDMIALTAKMKTFYDSMWETKRHMCVSLAATNPHTVEWSQITPGSPGAADDTASELLATVHWGTTAAIDVGQINFPAEVAIVLSFAAEAAGVPEEAGMTRPKARRRGRMYLGPWQGGCSETDTVEGTTNVNNATQVRILDAYEAFIASARLTDPTIQHVVYSPSDGVARNIIEASVDNEFDTVRSRGFAAGNRLVRSIAAP